MEPITAVVPSFELVTPPADADNFTVGGVTYTRSDGLFVGRQKIFQRFQVEFGNGLSMQAFAGNVAEAKEALNNKDFVRSAYAVESIVQGIAMVGHNRIREVETCALFFNAPDEDPTTYDAKALAAKVARWESVHSGFFFVAALRCMQIGYGSMYPLPGMEPPTPSDEA